MYRTLLSHHVIDVDLTRLEIIAESELSDNHFEKSCTKKYGVLFMFRYDRNFFLLETMGARQLVNDRPGFGVLAVWQKLRA